MAVNEQKLHELLGKGIVDFGATFHAALIAITGRSRAISLCLTNRQALTITLHLDVHRQCLLLYVPQKEYHVNLH